MLKVFERTVIEKFFHSEAIISLNVKLCIHRISCFHCHRMKQSIPHETDYTQPSGFYFRKTGGGCLFLPYTHSLAHSYKSKQSQVRVIPAVLFPRFIPCTLNTSTHSSLNRGKFAFLGIQAKQKPQGSTCVCPLVAR